MNVPVLCACKSDLILSDKSVQTTITFYDDIFSDGPNGRVYSVNLSFCTKDKDLADSFKVGEYYPLDVGTKPL